MKTITGTYSFMVVAEDQGIDPQAYEGYSGQNHEGLHDFLTGVEERMYDIYGNIVDIHYHVEHCSYSPKQGLEFIVNFVVSGIPAGHASAEDSLQDDWPTDLIESVRVLWEDEQWPGVYGFDANNLREGPEMTRYRGW